MSTVHIQKTDDGKRSTETSLQVNEKIIQKIISRTCLQNIADGKAHSKDFWPYFA